MHTRKGATSAPNPKPQHSPAAIRSRTQQAARRIAIAAELERWERLLQCESDLATSTHLYFSNAAHPARNTRGCDWLQELANGGELLARQMHDCITRLNQLQGGQD
jgi:hypothetical protein